MRKTRCERYEQGDGHLCSIGNIVASVAGGLLGLASSGSSGEKKSETTPLWNEDQRRYLFGDAWSPELPQYTSGALNYASALAGGYNPATGPQGYQSFEGLLGGSGGRNPYSAENPWYLDPETGTSAYQPSAGISGLLGYGAGAAPPLLTSSPYFGNNVADPEGLKSYPGMEGFKRSGQTGEQQEQTSSRPTGTLVHQPGFSAGNALWGVQVGDNTIPLRQALDYQKAGLLDIDNPYAGQLSLANALAWEGANDAMLHG